MSTSGNPSTVLASFGSVEVTLPTKKVQSRRCIGTFIYPGNEAKVDDMLGSFYAYSECQDCICAVFVFSNSVDSMNVINKYQAVPIFCRYLIDNLQPDRSILYSIARFVDAQQFLCIDPNTLVLAGLQPLFSAIDACPTYTIFACAQNNRDTHRLNRESTILAEEPFSSPQVLLSTSQSAQSCIMEDSVFAGSCSALQTLDALTSALFCAPDQDISANLQFNVAIAQMQGVVELDPTYNVQLHMQEVKIGYSNGCIQAFLQEKRARIINFTDAEQTKYAAWRGFFARVPHPLVEKGDGDGYALFMIALRAWIGRYGMKVMAWSFYGLTDEPSSAWVRDPDTFPLFALLHYLIRANGCVRVLETGTARGVSAACIASAVAHRPNAKVVTLDPRIDRYPERKELWSSLPETVRKCIEHRGITSLEGMDAAIERGEMYEAVLLDSIHTEEYVWNEFRRALQLVCPSGLILIHDALLKDHTVSEALIRIEEAGYNVIRLWAAEGGIHEDDRLGLAVIENRKR